MRAATWTFVLTSTLVLGGCGIPAEPTRVLARYAKHRAEFQALAMQIEACRPEKRPANGAIEGPWIRTDKDSAPIVCTRPGQSAAEIKPMMRKLRIRAMASGANEDEPGTYYVSFGMEWAGLAISGTTRDLLFIPNGKPLDPGPDGKIVPADPADPRWYVLDSWT
jgi:hypothetical protein